MMWLRCFVYVCACVLLCMCACVLVCKYTLCGVVWCVRVRVCVRVALYMYIFIAYGFSHTAYLFLY